MKKKDKKPRHLFRAMTAQEVEEFWTRLKEKADKHERRANAMITGDGQGVRWMMREDFDAHSYQQKAFEQARHMFLDILTENAEKRLQC